MRDTITKVRALADMKTALINALRADLEALLAKYERKCAQNELLSIQNVALSAQIEELRANKPWFEHIERDSAYIEREMGEYGPGTSFFGTMSLSPEVSIPTNTAIEGDEPTSLPTK